MYYKGGNMLHTIRQLVGDDARWKAVLRGLNRDFRHQIVTGEQIEGYIAEHTGLPLNRVFEQYLRATTIPALEWRISGAELSFRWSDAVSGFDMPVPVELNGGAVLTLPATEVWQTMNVPQGTARITVDPDYYVASREVR
jgi:aminopeptidase N